VRIRRAQISRRTVDADHLTFRQLTILLARPRQASNSVGASLPISLRNRRSPTAQRVEHESGDLGLKKEMKLERAFVKAGGLLLAGPDPNWYWRGCGGVRRSARSRTASGSWIHSFRSIHSATSNGAQFLEEAEHIGTLAPGKQADLVVIRGNSSASINDIENVEIVFKDGVGFDSAKLIESVQGQVGLR